MPQSTKGSIQMKPYYHLQNSGSKLPHDQSTQQHQSQPTNQSLSPTKMGGVMNRTLQGGGH